MRSNFCTVAILMVVMGLMGHLAHAQRSESAEAGSPKREFRAAWVATVANIDWPSERNLTTQQQKDELIAILDKAVELNLNAIIFQVRPMCDALYASPYEPWSEYLTGVTGQAPDPWYDPLQFIIEESHKRGLELHAWFNPYRARHSTARSPLPENHVSRTHPELVKEYGTFLWLDPSEKEVQDLTMRVILDVVRRYNVDGVHIDDYFYPYKVEDDQGNVIEFPDDDSWKAYQESGGTLSRGDWRRQSVNTFVERFYREIKALKPRVKVGISPFGIWRPGHPEGITGLDQYSELYADAKLWLNEGWADYFSPQLYWAIDSAGQPYGKLLRWWVEQNTHGRHIWPGNFTSRMLRNEWTAEEIVNQIKLTRQVPGASGNVHFSMRALMRNSGGITDALKTVYAEPALIPESPWLEEISPELPDSGNE